jgi:hypothetical protein
VAHGEEKPETESTFHCRRPHTRDMQVPVKIALPSRSQPLAISLPFAIALFAALPRLLLERSCPSPGRVPQESRVASRLRILISVAYCQMSPRVMSVGRPACSMLQ